MDELNSKRFADFFREAGYERVASFDEEGIVGCSVVLSYPEEGISFYPARKRNGNIDSVVLVKVFFREQNVENGSVGLTVYTSLASDYFLKHPFASPFLDSIQDESAPTSEEKKRSEESKQPLFLFSEEGEYSFSLASNEFFIHNGLATPKDIIEKAYNEHIQTISSRLNLFQIKRGFQLTSGKLLLFFGKVILWLFSNFWNRSISYVEQNHMDDYLVRVLRKKINNTNLIPKELTKINIAGFTLVVSPAIIILSSLVFLLSYLLDSFGVISFAGSIKISFIGITTNPLLLISFLIAYIWLIDRVMLRVFMYFFNVLVVWNLKNEKRKIRV